MHKPNLDRAVTRGIATSEVMATSTLPIRSLTEDMDGKRRIAVEQQLPALIRSQNGPTPSASVRADFPDTWDRPFAAACALPGNPSRRSRLVRTV